MQIYDWVKALTRYGVNFLSLQVILGLNVSQRTFSNRAPHRMNCCLFRRWFNLANPLRLLLLDKGLSLSQAEVWLEGVGLGVSLKHNRVLLFPFVFGLLKAECVELGESI